MSEISIKEWLIAARPKTLTAAIIPVICGHLIVNYRFDHHISIALSTLALVCAIMIQIGTNYFNDVVDYKNGVDGDKRSGPKRLLQSGRVSETKMRAAAHTCFLGALVIGIPLIIKGGSIILAIGIISILIGYSYSAPPLKLAYRGLAEPFVVLFFGLIAVVGIEWLHSRTVSGLGIATGLQIGLLASVLLVINNIRDRNEDFERGKLTLVARFGRVVGASEVLLFYMTVAGLGFCDSLAPLKFPILNFIWLIPAAVVIHNVIKGYEKNKLNKTLGFAALTHLVFGICRGLQLLWS